MSEIIESIEEIIRLAKKAHDHITQWEGKKAKSELAKIIELDLKELRSIQVKHGGKRLLEECIDVLKNAKKALRDLDSYDLFPEANELIDKIEQIENHELLELQEEQKKLNELYRRWRSDIITKKVYHATSSLSVPMIEQFGLDPRSRPSFWSHFQRLFQLYKKAGHIRPLDLVHLYGGLGLDIVNKGVFVTPKYDSARDYAMGAPAIWFEFVGSRSYEEAKRKFFFHAFFHNIPAHKMIPVSIHDECLRIYESNPIIAYEAIIDYCTKRYGLTKDEICALSKEEIYEILSIFETLWNIFRDVKAVILHISVMAPAVANSPHFIGVKINGKFVSYVYSFQAFITMLKLIENRGKKLFEMPADDAISKFLSIWFFQGNAKNPQILITDGIPRKFITIEYL